MEYLLWAIIKTDHNGVPVELSLPAQSERNPHAGTLLVADVGDAKSNAGRLVGERELGLVFRHCAGFSHPRAGVGDLVGVGPALGAGHAATTGTRLLRRSGLSRSRQYGQRRSGHDQTLHGCPL